MTNTVFVGSYIITNELPSGQSLTSAAM